MSIITSNIQNAAEFWKENVLDISIFFMPSERIFCLFPTPLSRNLHSLQDWSLLGKVMEYIKKETLAYTVNHILIFNKPCFLITQIKYYGSLSWNTFK